MTRRLPSSDSLADPRIGALADLGRVVRAARARGALRIDDAAAFAGVSPDMLSRLENGKPVTTDRLLKVLESLGLEMWVVPKSQGLSLRDLTLRGARAQDTNSQDTNSQDTNSQDTGMRDISSQDAQ